MAVRYKLTNMQTRNVSYAVALLLGFVSANSI